MVYFEVDSVRNRNFQCLKYHPPILRIGKNNLTKSDELTCYCNSFAFIFAARLTLINECLIIKKEQSYD